MSDWPGILISGASGLFGAWVGGHATRKAAEKAADAAKTLAEQERAADKAERDAERVQLQAADIRAAIAQALPRLNNIDWLQRQGTSGQMSAEAVSHYVAEAKDAWDSVDRALTLGDYLLPGELRSRVESFRLLMRQATYSPLDSPIDAFRFSYQRVGVDVRRYGEYVRMSLEALIHGRVIPAHCDPPNLWREDQGTWVPDPAPDGWTDFAV